MSKLDSNWTSSPHHHAKTLIKVVIYNRGPMRAFSYRDLLQIRFPIAAIRKRCSIFSDQMTGERTIETFAAAQKLHGAGVRFWQIEREAVIRC